MTEPKTPTDDPLEQLRERIKATQEATERLASEAAGAARAQSEGRVPPQGYRTPQDTSARADEVAALAALLESLRTLVPAELQQQLTEVIRQILLLVRALIDFWVARLDPGERPAAAPPVAEDIPVA